MAIMEGAAEHQLLYQCVICSICISPVLYVQLLYEGIFFIHKIPQPPTVRKEGGGGIDEKGLQMWRALAYRFFFQTTPTFVLTVA